MNIRNQIIENIYNEFIENDNVNAFWLEGADGTNLVDEFSDIDIVLDVEDKFVEQIFEEFETMLLKFGNLDLNYIDDINHPKLKCKNYHIKGTNEYLIIDLSIQLNSRNKNEKVFIENDIMVIPKIIFDKKGIIKFNKFDTKSLKTKFKETIIEFKARYEMHSRVLKYVERGLFLEASMYYGKYVSSPIVELIRMKYTPRWHYMHLLHISHQIPNNEKLILEKLFKISSLKTIKENITYSKEIFYNLINEVEEMYKLNE